MEVVTDGEFNINLVKTSTKQVLLSTTNQTIIMMKLYQEIGFKVPATKFFGMGERVGDYMLKTGNYTLMPSMRADYQYD